MMPGNSIILQLVNKLFGFTPLTRWYCLRAQLLRIAGVDCARSARIVSSATIVIRNLSIGEDTFIGHQAFIGGNADAKITIGDNVDIALELLSTVASRNQYAWGALRGHGRRRRNQHPRRRMDWDKQHYITRRHHRAQGRYRSG